MDCHSPEANVMIKPFGYNPRPPYLEKFYGFPLTEANSMIKSVAYNPEPPYLETFYGLPFT